MPYGDDIHPFNLGRLTSGTPNAEPNEMAALEELLSSLETAPAPPRPRTGQASTALGIIGDSLLAQSRIMSGGQAPDMGPFAARMAQRQDQFDQDLARSQEESRSLRNNARVRIFETQQRNAEKAKLEREQRDAAREAFMGSASVISAQVPSVVEQAEALSTELSQSPHPEDQLVAKAILGAGNAVKATQEAVQRLGESGNFNLETVRQYESAVGNLNAITTDAIAARAQAERASRLAAENEAKRAEAERAADERAALREAGMADRQEKALLQAAELAADREAAMLKRQAIQRASIEKARMKNRIASSKISETASIIGAVDDLASFLTTNSNIGGPGAGRFPAVTETRTIGFAKMSNIASILLKARSGGAVTDAEYIRLKPFIPLATDYGWNRNAKLIELRKELMRVAAARAAEVGLQPGEFQAILKAGKTGVLDIEQILNERDQLGNVGKDGTEPELKLRPGLIPAGDAEFD